MLRYKICTIFSWHQHCVNTRLHADDTQIVQNRFYSWKIWKPYKESARRTVLLYMSRTRLVSLPLGSQLQHGVFFPESSMGRSRFSCFFRIGRFCKVLFWACYMTLLCCKGWHNFDQFCFSKLNWCCSILSLTKNMCLVVLVTLVVLWKLHRESGR